MQIFLEMVTIIYERAWFLYDPGLGYTVMIKGHIKIPVRFINHYILKNNHLRIILDGGIVIIEAT